jgi:hypothetical protein
MLVLPLSVMLQRMERSGGSAIHASSQNKLDFMAIQIWSSWICSFFILAIMMMRDERGGGSCFALELTTCLVGAN